MQMIIRKDNDPLAVAARVTFLSLIAGVSFASLAPSNWVPHLLYSYHLEHFAAFYLMTLSMAAARYHVSPSRLLLDVAVLASILEAMRVFAPPHEVSAAEDWVADIGGILAALSPMFVADFRRSFRERPPPPIVVEGDDS
ncbi:MAG: VanZ like protein [Caulobacteraceae bacterium]|nr:VanZ like protein [Caulobacteraceae bacterium]